MPDMVRLLSRMKLTYPAAAKFAFWSFVGVACLVVILRLLPQNGYNEEIRYNHETEQNENDGSSLVVDERAGVPALENSLANAVSLAPGDIVFDAKSNYYITSNHQVFKIDPATGKLHVVAGNGVEGDDGDGGPALQARFRTLNGIAFDGRGNLYIVDGESNRVRKVDHSSGFITTVAGSGECGQGGDKGPATRAKLCHPSGIAVDHEDNLYVADYRRIRRVDRATGIITTVAGNGEGVSPEDARAGQGDNGPASLASLPDVRKIVVDRDDSLLVADYQNSRVRKINHATGIVTTIAGNGAFYFNEEDKEPTRFFSGHARHENDGGDNIPAVDAIITHPNGLAIDSQGNIYVAERFNIRKIDVKTGLISTVVGGNGPGFSGDNGKATRSMLGGHVKVAVDGNGNIYIADTVNKRVRRVDKNTGIIRTVAGIGNVIIGHGSLARQVELREPQSIAFDGDGNLYILEGGNAAMHIRRVDHNSGTLTTLAGGDAVRSNFGGDGGTAKSAEFNGAQNLALDRDGNIYVADTQNNRIRKIDRATNIIHTIVGDGTAGFRGDEGAASNASVKFPSGVAADRNGDLYISDTGNARIRKVDHTDGVIHTIQVTGIVGYGNAKEFSGGNDFRPESLRLDSEGNVFVAAGFHIYKIDIKTGTAHVVAGKGGSYTGNNSGDGALATLAEIAVAGDIAIGANGDLYFCTHNGIRRIDHATGIIDTVAGNGSFGYGGHSDPATHAALNEPRGLAIDSNGDIYFADSYNNVVRKVDHASGKISSVAGVWSQQNVLRHPSPE